MALAPNQSGNEDSTSQPPWESPIDSAKRENALEQSSEEIGIMTTATLQSARSNIWWVFLLQGIAGILLGLMRA